MNLYCCAVDLEDDDDDDVAVRSKAGEGLAGEEYIEEGAACPDWKEDEDI